MAKPKYPEIVVQLTGEDGNAFFIVSRVRSALRKGVNEATAVEYFNKALSGDYNNVLQVTQEYVTVR